PLLNEKTTFDWTDVPFARALRQVCQRYRLHPGARPGGYTLYPEPGGAPAPGKRVGLVEKDGVRLYVRAVSVSMNRRVSFVGDQPPFDNSSLALDFGGELETGDAATIAGIDNVSARDDTGNVMLSQVGRSSLGSPYPDEWQGGVSLLGMNPRARKLEWVEGDLMVYKKYQPRRVEVPLPLPAGWARKQEGTAAGEGSAREVA